MTERAWYASATMEEMREALRKDFTIFGACGIDPLKFVGESCGVYVFSTPCGNGEEMVFRVTPDMQYTVEHKTTAAAQAAALTGGRAMAKITAVQAGEILGVDGHTVRNWIEEKLLDGNIAPSKTGARRHFTTTPEAVEEFRTKQARRLSLTHALAKSQRGTTRTNPGHGPALPIKPLAVAMGPEPETPAALPLFGERRLVSLEAQVRRLFADTEGNRKAVAALNDALVRVEADLRSGKATGPVRRVLLRVLGFMPQWL